MIRKTWNDDKWLLTAQPEHARLAAIIASAWNYNGEKPHEEVIKAIIRHDDGWKEMEKTPPVKPNGDPRSFHEMHAVDALPIYDKSIKLLREDGLIYAAALVTGHFLYIAEQSDMTKATVHDSIAAGKFIARKRKLLVKLKNQVSKDDQRKHLLDNFETDLRFLQVCDYLSLLLCTDFNATDTIDNVPYLDSGKQITVSRKASNLALTVSPLPFKKNLRDHLTSWIVPFVPYESPEELAAAMDEVKSVSNEIHIGTA